MAGENVSNYFQQPQGGGTDNILVLGGSVQDASGNNHKLRYLTAQIADVSTAASIFIHVPFNGTLKKLHGRLQAAITGANAVITSEKNGVLITDGGFTVTQSGSAAGDLDTATPSAGNVFEAGDVLEVITDGASTGAAIEFITAEFELA